MEGMRSNVFGVIKLDVIRSVITLSRGNQVFTTPVLFNWSFVGLDY